QARRADLGLPRGEIRKHLVVDINAQADAELLGIAAGELVLDAARLVGAVIERGRRVARHDPELARTSDALEDRGRRRARAEQRAQHDGGQHSQLGGPPGSPGTVNYTGIGWPGRRTAADLL